MSEVRCLACDKEIKQKVGVVGRKSKYCNKTCRNTYYNTLKYYETFRDGVEARQSKLSQEYNFKVKSEMDYLEDFENNTDCTVGTFNKIYKYSRIHADNNLTVEIGDLEPGGLRLLTLSNGKVLKNPMIRFRDNVEGRVRPNLDYFYETNDGYIFSTLGDLADDYMISIAHANKIHKGKSVSKLPNLKIYKRYKDE